MGGDRISLRNIGDTYFIDVSLSVDNEVGGVAKDGSLMFMLTNDSVITFNSTDLHLAQLERVGQYRVNRLSATYYATVDQLRVLGAEPVTDIRMYFIDGFDEFEIKAEAARRKISSAVNCLLSAPE